jgi:hypothetical protein
MPFYVRVYAAAARIAAACIGGETGHPRDLGCQRFEKASRKPLDRVPYTRLAVDPL